MIVMPWLIILKRFIIHASFIGITEKVSSQPRPPRPRLIAVRAARDAVMAIPVLSW